MAPEIELSPAAGAALFHAAMHIAYRGHRGKVGKGGDPYIYHALHVGVAQLPDWQGAILGVLHDVIEDCSEDSVVEVKGLYATAPWLRHDLDLSTRQKDTVTYADYIERIFSSGNQRVLKVKITDLRHNLDAVRFSKALVLGKSTELFALRERYLKALDKLTGYRILNKR